MLEEEEEISCEKTAVQPMESVNDDVYEEETEEDLRRACQREIRSSVQLRCEVFVEYCTAARTSKKTAARRMDDRTQVDGFTLQGSTEAYLRRFEELRKELMDQGLLPSNRIKMYSNFECFHLLYTAAAEAADQAPHACSAQRQNLHETKALDSTVGGNSASVTGLMGASRATASGSASRLGTQAGRASFSSNATLCGDKKPVAPTRGWGGKVNARPPPEYKARSAMWGDGTRTLIGNHAATGVPHADVARHFPRIGAFEVYFRAWPHAPVQLIHSKLLNGKFKSVQDIVSDICIGLRRAAAACELSVWQGTFVPPPLVTSRPAILAHPSSAQHAPTYDGFVVDTVVGGVEAGQEAVGRGQGAGAARWRRPGSPRQFRRVFGSMQPQTDLHPKYPAQERPVSPRVVSPRPRQKEAAIPGDERQLACEGGPPPATSSHEVAAGMAPGAASAADWTSNCRNVAGRGTGDSGPAVGEYRDMMRHGLTPPAYLFADVRAGSGDFGGEAQGASGAWGLAAMMSSCSRALDAVGAHIKALVTIVESRARAGVPPPPALLLPRPASARAAPSPAFHGSCCCVGCAVLLLRLTCIRVPYMRVPTLAPCGLFLHGTSRLFSSGTRGALAAHACLRRSWSAWTCLPRPCRLHPHSVSCSALMGPCRNKVDGLTRGRQQMCWPGSWLATASWISRTFATYSSSMPSVSTTCGPGSHPLICLSRLPFRFLSNLNLPDRGSDTKRATIIRAAMQDTTTYSTASASWIEKATSACRQGARDSFGGGSLGRRLSDSALLGPLASVSSSLPRVQTR